jgi:hypothetical protein
MSSTEVSDCAMVSIRDRMARIFSLRVTTATELRGSI